MSAEKEIQQRLDERSRKKGSGRFARFFRAIGKKFKDIFAELKKVTWPSFRKVMSQTGIVVAVVLFFLVIVYVFDLGLSQLYKLLMDRMTEV